MRVLLRPRWLVGTIIAVLLIVLFVNLGFWQLRRLDEKRDRNAAIRERGAEPVEPVDRLVDARTGFDDVGRLVYRRASARGRYDPDGEVRIRSRSLDGRPGEWVVTPLRLDDGTALAVNRGFVPLSTDVPAPPSGEVEVTGLLFASQHRQGIGPRDPTDGRLAELSRLDLARLQEQYQPDLFPMWLQLQRQDPPVDEDALPVLLPEPEQDEGPHLSYAVQWFLFATVGAIGWPILLRRTAREDERRRRRGPSPPDDDADRTLEAAR
jgi:cytochrome oxidase assembly protein ShyY1